jgi:thioredoxin-like negative regulator of GroEL
MVGFPPTGYTFAQEQSNIEQGIDKAVGRERSRLLKQYYVARRQGDYPESKKVFEDMLSFSKKHPSARINYESLKRSYKGHQRTTAKMHNGTTLSPMMKRVLEEQRKEYDTSSLFD